MLIKRHLLCHDLLLGLVTLRHSLCLGVEELVLDLLGRRIDLLHGLGTIGVGVGGAVHRLKVVVYQHTIISHRRLS